MEERIKKCPPLLKLLRDLKHEPNDYGGHKVFYVVWLFLF